jgi:hypothetical protein
MSSRALRELSARVARARKSTLAGETKGERHKVFRECRDRALASDRRNPDRQFDQGRPKRARPRGVIRVKGPDSSDERPHVIAGETLAAEAIEKDLRGPNPPRPGQDVLVGSVDLPRGLCSGNCHLVPADPEVLALACLGNLINDIAEDRVSWGKRHRAFDLYFQHRRLAAVVMGVDDDVVEGAPFGGPLEFDSINYGSDRSPPLGVLKKYTEPAERGNSNPAKPRARSALDPPTLCTLMTRSGRLEGGTSEKRLHGTNWRALCANSVFSARGISNSGKGNHRLGSLHEHPWAVRWT